ncbi:DNRLRE domain-containing protein [Panacibacter sp. DH6]|uniref:DNRLRE domain-containing protein n=1 Tax=Panacibacter microcysteis TaxID=2793269 RepID=A0A931GVH4_9BACT|nr:DNRLRE domain-containing protein [Panacibacter microcysteis]MBG9376390.1 DNRLRE domain-containing protein [Panacibacter microcysteis]
MKNISNVMLLAVALTITSTSCKKSIEEPSEAVATVTSDAALAQNTVDLTSGDNAMLHGLQGYQTTNYNQFPSFQSTVWTYLGTPAPRRSLLKFDFTNLNPLITASTLVSAKLYLYQYDELNNSGNYYSIAQVNNSSEIRRVKTAWTPSTVNWQTQPLTYPGLPTLARNAVAVPAITTPFAGNQDNPVINVTQMVKQMLAGGAPYSNNHGFEIIFPNETQFYKGRTFGSFASPAGYKPVLRLTWQ